MKREWNFATTLLSVLVAQAVPMASVFADGAMAKPSQVLRLEIPKLVQGRYDVVVTLYQRDGKFHMGYAQVPERDNMVHRIDLAPSKPIAFVEKGGKKMEVKPEWRGSYSYGRDDWKEQKARYYNGEIDIVHTAKTPPLTFKGKKLSGMLEIKINHLDAVNGPGRGNSSLIYRMQINGEDKNGQLSGKAVYWQYARKDDDYGKDNHKTTVDIKGQWQKDYWKAKPGSEYAKGKDWPMAHGPNLTGAAIDSDTPLVNTLHDARLVWVADLPLGSGRGGGNTRGDFAMFPISWTTLWQGGYGAPIMADNKVFVYAPSPDLDAIRKHPDLERNPYYRLGSKLGHFANQFAKNRESIFAFDAQTGTLVWQYYGKPGGVGFIGGKSGKASTPCYYDGKVYTRINAGIICLDANTGEKIWLAGSGIASGSSDASVTQVGGTLILVSTDRKGNVSTLGLDPKVGSVKWTVAGFGAPGYGIPGLYREKGKEYLVLGRRDPDPKGKMKPEERAPASFVMVDPVDGKTLWESDALAYNYNHILVAGDMAIGNFKKGDPKAKHDTGAYRIAGVKISTKGAKRLWTNEEVNPQAYRNMYIAKHGVYYSDSRSTDFTATDIKTGERLAKRPTLYSLSHVSHNWSWQIGSNDRILSEGIMMYSTVGQGLELLPGRLGNSVSGGYRSPTKPLIADGRLIFRMPDKLVCYDLRMHKEAAETEVINLIAEKAAAVFGPVNADVKIRIRKRGDKLISLGGEAPYLRSEDTTRTITWGPQDWSAVSSGRTVVPHDLTLTGDSLEGTSQVRLGYQYEPFRLELKRDGKKFSGTYTRRVKALEKPVAVSGDIYGKILSKDDGTRIFAIYLAGAAANGEKLIAGEKPNAGMELIVSVGKNDQVTAVTAAAGKLNQMCHEVEVESLKVKGNNLKGKVTVITHDDRYYDVDPRPASREFRSVGEGGALAFQYSFDSKGILGKDPKTGEKRLENRGRYTGTLGVAWQCSGMIFGQLVLETVP